jgi:hypothetical protein
LVWASNPINDTCEVITYTFCVSAIVGYAANSTVTAAAASSTTIIERNATTIIHYGTANTTTIISSSGGIVVTGIVVGPNNLKTQGVDVWVLVQNATTGQNVTMGGGPLLGNSCTLQPTGLTRCIVAGNLIGEGSLKLTVWVTNFVGVTVVPRVTITLPE